MLSGGPAHTGPARAVARATCTPQRPSRTVTSAVTTTSSCATVQAAIAADIAEASDAADPHAACGPADSCPAAASAARSAVACARCLAITAEPTDAPPTVNAISTAIIAAATTLAEPRSESGLDRGHRLRANRDAGQQD